MSVSECSKAGGTVGVGVWGSRHRLLQMLLDFWGSHNHEY